VSEADAQPCWKFLSHERRFGHRGKSNFFAAQGEYEINKLYEIPKLIFLVCFAESIIFRYAAENFEN